MALRPFDKLNGPSFLVDHFFVVSKDIFTTFATQILNKNSLYEKIYDTCGISAYGSNALVCQACDIGNCP